MQDLFMIGLQKAYGMQDQMIQISDLLRMMCLRRKWLCAEVIQICIKRCLMRQVFRLIYVIGWAGGQGHAWNLVYCGWKMVFILILHWGVFQS